ncbi:MAG: hypothetical protein ACKOA8_00725, partial [Deltaproteobacteria bacterium]
GRKVAKRLYFNSLAHFFSLLQDPTLVPVTLIDKTQLRGDRASKEVFQTLGKKTTELSGLIGKLHEATKDNPSMDVANLLGQLRLLSDLLQSGDFEAIELDWVKNLRSPKFEAGWQQLFVHHFDITVEVISELIQVIDLMGKSRV